MTIPFTVQRSTLINKPASELYSLVGDFNSWPHWSPWLIQEPDCPVHISGRPGQIGHKQEWDGEKIGAGNIQLIEHETNEHLLYDLHFLRPWKSHSQASFTFVTKGDQTEVIWSMNGSVPAIMFMMKSKIINMVGSDYEKGLAMLKEHVES